MIQKIAHYVEGQWVTGEGDGHILRHAITGEPIFTHSTQGLDFKAILAYGRSVGNPNLRKMTFQERGLMLKALALHLHEKKEMFYALSQATGATRSDSWIDIEGGIGNLFAYASLRRQFPNEPHYIDGETAPLSRGGSFVGQHIMTPKEGVAVHINAFNFPIWGYAGKSGGQLAGGYAGSGEAGRANLLLDRTDGERNHSLRHSASGGIATGLWLWRRHFRPHRYARCRHLYGFGCYRQKAQATPQHRGACRTLYDGSRLAQRICTRRRRQARYRRV